MLVEMQSGHHIKTLPTYKGGKCSSLEVEEESFEMVFYILNVNFGLYGLSSTSMHTKRTSHVPTQLTPFHAKR